MLCNVCAQKRNQVVVIRFFQWSQQRRLLVVVGVLARGDKDDPHTLQQDASSSVRVSIVVRDTVIQLTKTFLTSGFGGRQMNLPILTRMQVGIMLIAWKMTRHYPRSRVDFKGGTCWPALPVPVMQE
jgi:hypothetical protein